MMFAHHHHGGYDVHDYSRLQFAWQMVHWPAGAQPTQLQLQIKCFHHHLSSIYCFDCSYFNVPQAERKKTKFQALVQRKRIQALVVLHYIQSQLRKV